MNYSLIHNKIISRALNENRVHDSTKYESHHILPRCEGGLDEGSTVFLTFKEHYIVHLLRNKISGVKGNKIAYNLMKFGCLTPELRKEFSKLGAKASHTKFKEKNPEKYTERQRKAGTHGGNKCVLEKLGFHAQSQEQLKLAQEKGRKTLQEKGLGIFSKETKEALKLSLMRKVRTPEGIFYSMNEAAKNHNISNGTVTYRVNNKLDKWSQWAYIEENDYE